MVCPVAGDGDTAVATGENIGSDGEWGVVGTALRCPRHGVTWAGTDTGTDIGSDALVRWCAGSAGGAGSDASPC